MTMLKFLIKRILVMIPTLLGILFIIFTINYFTPGDPALNALGSNYTEEAYQAKRAEMGLDQPFLVRYGLYLRDLVTKFDMGTSYSTLRPVRDMIAERLVPTVKIGLISSILTVIIGVLVGIISAVKQYSITDYICTTLAIFFAAMPGFWLSLMCMLVFCVHLNWLPTSGLTTWKHYILPVLSLAIGPIAVVMRMTRSSMLDVIRQDYIRTARAKGLSERVIIYRHALKNALIPVITIIGMQLSMVVSGSVITESIFSIPGIGMLMLNAIGNRDYPVIQSTVLVLSFAICVVNLLVDIAYAFADPRIRAQYTANNRKKDKRKAGKGVTA